ncbi:hypothetical protein GIB67_003905 [Kingdonia uniflora]|uniref:RanBP2-type domain-containing protein n=1 Tax=Kingdonia uniflora TaxID=39325 RepID=A0A7J7LK61_9MAGN|nr:hypothetical protein GIB67_003905 [Kingdonia uniflora]
MVEGREGDWECGGCRNRNYAFRSFCNRCKQTRLLVDTKPADSKWLPRIGDWICSGCSNNNYASRDLCKKCGEPKEVAAMPALGMLGASLPTYSPYFARAQGAIGVRMNIGLSGNPLSNYNWPLGGTDKYGHPLASGWLSGGNNNPGFPYVSNANQQVVQKDWRSGDWICNCGFHNYASRSECKKCNASMPSTTPSAVNPSAKHMIPTHGTKRLASDEFITEWDNKRLNAGDISHHFWANGRAQSYEGLERAGGSSNGQASGMYIPYLSGSSAIAPNSQVHMLLSQLETEPTLVGKGAKQWRDGDWMCTNCDNHNYASRSQCNRCKTERDAQNQSASIA